MTSAIVFYEWRSNFMSGFFWSHYNISKEICYQKNKNRNNYSPKTISSCCALKKSFIAFLHKNVVHKVYDGLFLLIPSSVWVAK